MHPGEPLDSIQLLLLALLAAAGCGYTVMILMQETKRWKGVTALGTVCVFACAAFYAGRWYLAADCPIREMKLGLIAFACFLMLIAAYCFFHNVRDTNWLFLLVFLVYCGAVLYLTYFSRGVNYWKAVERRLFADEIEAYTKGTWKLLEHDALNIAMMVPAGFLIPLINRPAFGSFGHSFFFGLIFSLYIELIQLITFTGKSDVNDIVWNTVGAILGYLLIRAILDLWDAARERSRR